MKGGPNTDDLASVNHDEDTYLASPYQDYELTTNQQQIEMDHDSSRGSDISVSLFPAEEMELILTLEGSTPEDQYRHLRGQGVSALTSARRALKEVWEARDPIMGGQTVHLMGVSWFGRFFIVATSGEDIHEAPYTYIKEGSTEKELFTWGCAPTWKSELRKAFTLTCAHLSQVAEYAMQKEAS